MKYSKWLGVCWHIENQLATYLFHVKWQASFVCELLYCLENQVRYLKSKTEGLQWDSNVYQM